LGAEALSGCVALGVPLPTQLNSIMLRLGNSLPTTSTKLDFSDFPFCQ
uniref:RAVR2 protein n=1 Tax=Anisakis simplex TaxID=6269 RepID=A0A0M3KG16_ANISI